MVLEKIDYKQIFYYFEEISRIPRGSGDVGAVSQYLVDFARERNLRYIQDEALNVVIYKEGTKGKEQAQTVILQGHMDMVCEKTAGSLHDFKKDGISLVVEGDYIRADGTTLGADDGIALAYGLAVLDSHSISHPPLEVLFTTDEETGMDGAKAFDTSFLKGSFLLNIDSEEEGTLLLGAAGGKTISSLLPVEWEGISEKTGSFYEIKIEGLLGGHSGTEIDKGRVNAVHLLSRLLWDLRQDNQDFSLCSMQGGNKDNVIPAEASAVLWAGEGAFIGLENAVLKYGNLYQMENQVNDPGLSVSVNKRKIGSYDEKKDVPKRLKGSSLDKMLFFLNQAPDGIQRMSFSMPGIVESSINLGIFKLTGQGALVDFSIRSSISSYKEFLAQKLISLSKQLGAVCEIKGEYPAWEYHFGSEFAEICREAYIESYKEEPVLTVIHAGLECGILSEKKPGLQIVSIGADTLDIHSPSERLSISSAKRVFDYVLCILGKIN